MMISLLLRNLIFTVLQPGLVAGLIPYLLLRIEGRPIWPGVPGVWQFSGAAFVMLGFAVMMTCILQFAVEGGGTLSPLDPTKKLVVNGFYRYSRNPMYIGVVLLLIGEALFYHSIILAIYAAIVFICFNLFVVFHEEPRARRDFGIEWEEYAKQVRRWF